MHTKKDGDKSLEVLSKYREEREVDESDEETLDRLVAIKCVAYTLKDDGTVHAKVTPLAEGLVDPPKKTTS